MYSILSTGNIHIQEAQISAINRMISPQVQTAIIGIRYVYSEEGVANEV